MLTVAVPPRRRHHFTSSSLPPPSHQVSQGAKGPLGDARRLPPDFGGSTTKNLGEQTGTSPSPSEIVV